jgi:hypothetical protein
MLFKLRSFFVVAGTLAFAACGGGGGGGGGGGAGSLATTGVVVDGYVVNATVQCNVDKTGLPSSANFPADAISGQSGHTDINGRYIFSNGCHFGVIVTGGKSKDTGLDFKGILRAPDGATVVSPLTTLIAALMDLGKTAVEAQALINRSLQLNDNTDLLHTDPAALSGAGYANLALLKANLIVQSLIQITTDNIAALASSPSSVDTNPIYAATASALATTLANDLRPLNTEIVTAFIAKAANSVAALATTPSEVKTTLAGNGSIQLASITAVAVNNLAQTFSDPTKISSTSTVAQIAAVTATVQSDLRIAMVIASVTSNPATPLASMTAATISNGVNALPAPTVTPQPVTSVSSSSTAVTTTTTSTAATTTTTSTTTTTTLANNFLYLANDSVSFDNGTNVTPYTLSQFQTGAGIPIQWPLANSAAIKFALADGGAFVPSNQTYSAALSIADTASSAQVSAYVDSVTLTKNGSSITVTVPGTANGRVYFKSAESTEVLCSWTNCGPGDVTNTLSTSGALGGIVIGQTINNAVAHMSSLSAMSGKYVVTLVVSGLPMSYGDRTTPLPIYSVSVPNGTVNPTLIVGSGLQGYITVTNTNGVTTTTTTTTTVATTTTTTLSPAQSYLTLANDTIIFNDGAATNPTATPYTMAQLKTGQGITVKWPMADAANLSFTLTETGTYVPVAGQTLTAAMSLVDTAAGSVGKIQAYIDNVTVTRSSAGIKVTVPSSATAMFYGVTSDGSAAALLSFSNLVAGVTNTLGTGVSNITVGGVVNSAVANAGSSFSGINALTGTYAMTLVVTDLPLRQSNGSTFPSTTITVPTSLAGTNVRSIVGGGITGFITLIP